MTARFSLPTSDYAHWAQSKKSKQCFFSRCFRTSEFLHLFVLGGTFGAVAVVQVLVPMQAVITLQSSEPRWATTLD
eukprot:6122894-Amphidinium_carterae.1